MWPLALVVLVLFVVSIIFIFMLNDDLKDIREEFSAYKSLHSQERYTAWDIHANLHRRGDNEMKALLSKIGKLERELNSVRKTLHDELKKGKVK